MLKEGCRAAIEDAKTSEPRYDLHRARILAEARDKAQQEARGQKMFISRPILKRTLYIQMTYDTIYYIYYFHIICIIVVVYCFVEYCRLVVVVRVSLLEALSLVFQARRKVEPQVRKAFEAPRTEPVPGTQKKPCNFVAPPPYERIIVLYLCDIHILYIYICVYT